MKHFSLMLVCTIAAWSLPLLSAEALEDLSAKELADHCRALPDNRGGTDGIEGQYCIRYIQGFIDGARATDVRVMLNLEAEAAGKETFSERAIRTRSRNRDGIRRAAVYAEFCLGDPVPLREVVDKVVDDLGKKNRSLPDQTARTAVYASLRKHYPCKKPDKVK